MAPTQEYTREPSAASVGQAAAGVIERAEERVGSIIETMDSAAQTIQNTLQRTEKSARAAIGKVAGGLDTSTKYLTDRGIGGVVEDGEALIRRYPFQAFLIGCSVGFLLSRSRPR